MGRHAAPMTEAAAVAAEPTRFAPPVPPAPSAAPASPAFAAAPAHPTTAGYAPAAATAPGLGRDRFTAVNLLVPQQQTLPVRALVWGILSILFSVVVAPAVFAVVFGGLGIRRARRLQDAGLGPQGRGLSIAGLTLGVVSLAILLFEVLSVVLALLAARSAGGYPS